VLEVGWLVGCLKRWLVGGSVGGGGVWVGLGVWLGLGFGWMGEFGYFDFSKFIP